MKKIAVFLLASLLVLVNITIKDANTNAAEGVAVDFTSAVNVKDTYVYYDSWDGSKVPLYENGVISSEKLQLGNGSDIGFDFFFDIPQEGFMDKYKAGDFFIINFTATNMKFTATPEGLDREIRDASGEVVFTYVLREKLGDPNTFEMVFTLTEAGSKHTSYANGKASAKATINWATEDVPTTVVVNGTKIIDNLNIEDKPYIPPNPGDGDPIGPYYPEVDKNIPEDFTKGVSLEYDEAINKGTYRLTVNKSNLADYYAGKENWQVENYVVVDTLGANQEFYGPSYIGLYAPLIRPGYEGTEIAGITANSAWWINSTPILPQFTLVEQAVEETDEEFLARIAANPLTYGFTNDMCTFSMNFGNLPGNGIKIFANDSAIDSFVDTMYPTTKYTAEAIEQVKSQLHFLYGSTSPVNLSPIYYELSLSVKVTNINHKEYINTANATYTKPGGEVIYTEDYAVLENSMYEATIAPGSAQSAKLEKKDSVTGEPLVGAGFTLQVKDETGAYTFYGEEQFTNAEGVVEFTRLPNGTYRFVETTTPAGYLENTLIMTSGHITTVLDPDGSFTISETYKEGILVLGTNQKEPDYEIKLTKSDVDTADLLANAVFTVEKYDGTNWRVFNTMTTNETGVALLSKTDGLTTGEYRLSETTAPLGYDMNSAVYSGIGVTHTGDHAYFTIDNSDSGHAIVISATNKFIPVYDLEVKKVDAETNEALEGATFVLQRNNGINWVAVKTITTDATGIASIADTEGLLAGNYRLYESEAPTGYDKTEVTYSGTNIFQDGMYATFTLDENVRAQSIVMEATNKFIPLYSLSLTKVAADDATELLAGAEFMLQRNVAGTWIDVQTITTDVNGVASVANTEGLVAGEYRLYETNAPVGFDINSAVYSGTGVTHTEKYAYFTFDETQRTQEIAMNATNEFIPLYSLSLTKVAADDATELLAGAEFMLQRNVAGTWIDVQTITTDVNGVASVANTEGLVAGEYRLYETKAPVGFDMNSAVYSGTGVTHTEKYAYFTFDETQRTQEIAMNATNEFIPLYSLSLTKVAADDATELLAGAEFMLQRNVAGTWIDVQTITTDVNGVASVANTEGLVAGEYRLYETKAPVGFDMNSAVYSGTGVTHTEKYAYFTFDETQRTQEIAMNATNEFISQYGIELTKRAADDATELLAGAEFMLQRNVAGTWMDVETIITDVNGVARVANTEGLVAGEYRLYETKAPTDYDRNSAVYTGTNVIQDGVYATFTLDASQRNQTIAIHATNTKYVRSIAITKRAADDATDLLMGTEFTVKRLNGTAWEDVITFVTDENGYAAINDYELLTAGEYRIFETKATDGYDIESVVFYQDEVALAENYISFTIEDGMDTVLTYNATNKFISQYGIELTKRAADDTTELLADAEFMLQRNVAGTWVDVQTLITDVNGYAKIDNTAGLVAGEYRLYETKAPIGFDINSAIYTGTNVIQDGVYATFTLDENQRYQTVSIDATNKFITIFEIVINKRDVDTNETLAGVEFIVEQLVEDTWVEVGVYTTDIDGSIVVNNGDGLQAGLFRVYETKAHPLYEITSAVYTGSGVEQNGQYAEVILIDEEREYTATVEVTNKRKPIEEEVLGYIPPNTGDESNTTSYFIFVILSGLGYLFAKKIQTKA